MHIADLDRVADELTSVTATTRGGRRLWRYHGRLVARELDEQHVVIRADFDVRASMVAESPATFSVPHRYEKHMMVVADLADGDAAAIESAFVAAWDLQQRAD